MPFYRKPAFWLLLLFWQLLAFLAAACLATGSYLLANRFHLPPTWVHTIIHTVGPISHLLLAILAFFLAKRRVQTPLPSQGFPILLNPTP